MLEEQNIFILCILTPTQSTLPKFCTLKKEGTSSQSCQPIPKLCVNWDLLQNSRKSSLI